MKKPTAVTLIVLTAVLFSEPGAWATGNADGSVRASTDLSMAAGSVVGVTASAAIIVLSSPILLVGAVADSVTAQNRAQIQVRDKNGNAAVIEVPKSTVENIGLKAGDQLEVTQRPSGVILSKDAKPIAFVVAPKSADLTKNEPLAH